MSVIAPDRESLQEESFLRQQQRQALAEVSIWAKEDIAKLKEIAPWKMKHSLNVGMLAYLIATKQFHYTAEEAYMFLKTGPIHDLGFLDVPGKEAILNKREPLTHKEFELQKMHVKASVQRLPTTKEYAYFGAIILWHHRFQHDSYPIIEETDKQIAVALVGEEKLYTDSYIFAMADQLEAVMAYKGSARPYRDPAGRIEAINLITHDRRNNPTTYFSRKDAETAAQIAEDFFKTDAF